MDAGRVRVSHMVGTSLSYPETEAKFIAVIEQLPDGSEECTIFPAAAAGSTTTAWISASTGSFVSVENAR